MNGNSWWTDRQAKSSKAVCQSFTKGEHKLSKFFLNPFKMSKTLFIFSWLSYIIKNIFENVLIRVIFFDMKQMSSFIKKKLQLNKLCKINTHPSLSSTLAHKMSFPRSAPTGIHDTVIFAVRSVINLISVWFVSRPPVLVTSNSSIFLFSEN